MSGDRADFGGGESRTWVPEGNRASVGSVVPAERAVAVHVATDRPSIAWGGTWALACGLVAADLDVPGASALFRGLAAWFVAVPLCGAVWALPAAGPSPRPAGTGVPAPAEGRSLAPSRIATAALATTVAGLLGPEIAAIVGITCAALVVFSEVYRRGIAPVGAARSALEIGLPALVGWLALDGPEAVPVALQVGGPLGDVAREWLRLNWLWPVLVGAFIVLHGAGSAATERSTLSAYRRLLAAAYLAAVAALAVADRPAAAAILAWLWIVQWPLQARFERGHVGEHWAGTERLAMAAMAVAAIAAR